MVYDLRFTIPVSWLSQIRWPHILVICRHLENWIWVKKNYHTEIGNIPLCQNPYHWPVTFFGNSLLKFRKWGLHASQFEHGSSHFVRHVHFRKDDVYTTRRIPWKNINSTRANLRFSNEFDVFSWNFINFSRAQRASLSATHINDTALRTPKSFYENI